MAGLTRWWGGVAVAAALGLGALNGWATCGRRALESPAVRDGPFRIDWLVAHHGERSTGSIDGDQAGASATVNSGGHRWARPLPAREVDRLWHRLEAAWWREVPNEPLAQVSSAVVTSPAHERLTIRQGGLTRVFVRTDCGAPGDGLRCPTDELFFALDEVAFFVISTSGPVNDRTLRSPNLSRADSASARETP